MRRLLVEKAREVGTGHVGDALLSLFFFFSFSPNPTPIVSLIARISRGMGAGVLP